MIVKWAFTVVSAMALLCTARALDDPPFPGWIQVRVDKKGKVRDPQVLVSGGKDADSSALEAVQQWRFKPAKCGTEIVESKIKIEVNIKLK